MKAKLIFYKANKGNFIDKAIALWTKGKYSHVEIYLEEFGFMYSSSGLDGGVRKKHHTPNPEHWDIVEVEISSNVLYEFFKQTNGAKYDYAAIFGFIIPFVDRENKWICSEWCSNVLKCSGDLRLLTKEPSKISPNRLHRILTGSKKMSLLEVIKFLRS